MAVETSFPKSARTYSRNLGQHSILAKKDTFFGKKGTKSFTPPFSIPFLSVVHQNKALYNFRKMGQYSIVQRNIGLEYALSAILDMQDVF